MPLSVGVIGTGWVGSSVAMSVLNAGFASELLLADVRHELAEGEAMDLAHGASFYTTATVRAVDVDAMLDTDAVVVAAGRGGKPGESRLDLLRDNAAMLRTLAERFSGYKGLFVVVTNPVDVLTYVAAKSSGIPCERVIGTGTMLDTARLRQVLGHTLRIDPHSVHAQVVGEHGDSEVVLWSSAHVGGTPLREWRGWSPDREAPIATEVRTAAYEIIKRKGATNHAIGARRPLPCSAPPSAASAACSRCRACRRARSVSTTSRSRCRQSWTSTARWTSSRRRWTRASARRSSGRRTCCGAHGVVAGLIAVSGSVFGRSAGALVGDSVCRPTRLRSHPGREPRMVNVV